jgi:hypothetical protein
MAIAGYFGLDRLDYSKSVKRADARKAGFELSSACVPSTTTLQETYTGKGDPYEGIARLEEPNPPAGFILDHDAPGVELIASCTSWSSILRTSIAGLIFGLIALVASVISQWVYRGFKKTEN